MKQKFRMRVSNFYINIVNMNRSQSIWLFFKKGPSLRRRGKACGFTMVELMVVVGIAALITALALPSFADFVQRFQIDRYAATLRGTINFARQQALRSGLQTVVCRRTSFANSCSTSSAEGFETGWIVFHDQAAGFNAATSTDRNGVFDSSETLIQATDGTSASFITQSYPNTATNNPPFVISGQGMSLANGNLCIKICARAACTVHPNNRYVIFVQSGHVRVETEAVFMGAPNSGVCQ